jgi:hypothetical protein
MKPLILEILSGPLDGQQIVLTGGAQWGRQAEGPLSFPWDAELGTPQAMITVEDDVWYIEAPSTPHPTERFGRTERTRALTGKTRLEPGDILRAGVTWLQIDPQELKH